MMCDKIVSGRTKGNLSYMTVVRSATMNRLQTVPLTKWWGEEFGVAQLKMLRFSVGVTRTDTFRNQT